LDFEFVVNSQWLQNLKELAVDKRFNVLNININSILGSVKLISFHIRTNFGRQSFGYFLSKLLNCIIKDNFILDVKEYCLYLKNNLTSLFESFIKNFF
jgi:hypothetical protein